MITHIWNEAGSERLGSLRAVPVCGKDFCDSCGDCLACYAEDLCPQYGEHHWVYYGSTDDFMAKHPGTEVMQARP